VAPEGGHLRCARNKGENGGRLGVHTCQAREGGLGWCAARGPTRGAQGIDGWMDDAQYRTVAGVAWLREQGLMEQRRAKTSSRPAADQRASSHLPLWVLSLDTHSMGSSAVRRGKGVASDMGPPHCSCHAADAVGTQRCLAICVCTLPRTRRHSTAGMCGPRHADMPGRPKGAPGP